MLKKFTGSQSLIHQVSVSDKKLARWVNHKAIFSLNPLFIRSQFQMMGIDGVEMSALESQSLIHQVSVSDLMKVLLILGMKNFVSIPYSSGLSFR